MNTCEFCHAHHPIPPAVFDEWLTSWHTGFWDGVLENTPLRHHPSSPLKQAAAYAAGYRAGQKARQELRQMKAEH